MKNSITFNYYNDGSHGWAKVKKSLLVKLGIEKMISKCSYMKGEFAYLEEDGDLSRFVEALEKAGIGYKAKDCSGTGERRSPIRNYDSYVFLTEEEELRIIKMRGAMLQEKNWNSKARKQIERASIESLEYWNKEYKLGF